jgi:hypothetical protein
MSLLATTNLTLADWAKRLDPQGGITAKIVELLMQNNEMLEEMTMLEGNLPTGHRTVVRTGLPTVAWRLINGGVLPSKSHTAQIDEQVGMLEAYSEVDRDLALLNGDVNGLRLSEARAFIEAMNQEMAQTVFYGTAAAPEEFVGLAARYSSLSAGNAQNVIDGAGTGAATKTSIWLVAWDTETITGIFPKGSQAGLYHEDLGLETKENAGGVTGALQRVYRDHWQWKMGIALKDWRYVVRIANIETSTAISADLIDLMEQAQETIPTELGRRVFYMNRTARRALRKLERSDVSSGGGTTYENVAGKRVLMFGDTPIRIVDAIVNTEAVVA